MTSIVIFAETDPKIGLGHVIRSTALAAAATKVFEETVLMTSERVAAVEWLAARYGVTYRTPSSEEWSLASEETAACINAARPGVVVADGPRITRAWSEAVRGRGSLLVYFGGIGIAEVPADGYLWPDVGFEGRSLPAETASGLAYAPLAPEYSDMRPRHRSGDIRKVLVTTGGVDRYDLTSIALRALDRVFEERLEVKLVLGAHFDNIESIDAEVRATSHETTVVESPGGLWQLMEWADLAVSGGGVTLCELACLGVPAVAVELSDNQGPMIREFHSEGAIVGLRYQDPRETESELCAALTRLRGHPQALLEMAGRGPKLVDGKGASRTIDWIKGVCESRGVCN